MFGLPMSSFLSFLIWPVIYIIVSIIMYFVMAKNDKRDEAWEKAYDKWVSEGGDKS